MKFHFIDFLFWQSLVRVLESSAANTPCYSLILFQDLLVSTTLSPVWFNFQIQFWFFLLFFLDKVVCPFIKSHINLDFRFFCQDDTINLFTYAVLRLTPRALSSGTSSWSYLRKGNIASNVVTETNVVPPSSMPESFYGSSDISPGEDNNYHVVRPLQSDKWSKGKDGYLVTDLWGAEVGTWVFATPTVLLQQTGERMYLCAYQHRSLTLMLLIPISSIPNGEQGVSAVKQQVLENVSFYYTEYFSS